MRTQQLAWWETRLGIGLRTRRGAVIPLLPTRIIWASTPRGGGDEGVAGLAGAQVAADRHSGELEPVAARPRTSWAWARAALAFAVGVVNLVAR
jgi:hypothetical protein